MNDLSAQILRMRLIQFSNLSYATQVVASLLLINHFGFHQTELIKKNKVSFIMTKYDKCQWKNTWTILTVKEWYWALTYCAGAYNILYQF